MEPVTGDDANNGTSLSFPVKSLLRAQQLARQGGPENPATVYLSAGTHRLNATLTLDYRDDFTTWRVNPNATGRAIISGGLQIPASSFKPVAGRPGVYFAQTGLPPDPPKKSHYHYPAVDDPSAPAPPPPFYFGPNPPVVNSLFVDGARMVRG